MGSNNADSDLNETNMTNQKKLANQPKIATPKPSDYIKKINKKRRQEQAARLAEKWSVTRLVDTTGMIDWPKSRSML